MQRPVSGHASTGSSHGLRLWPLLLLAACQAPEPPPAPVQAPVLTKPTAPVASSMPADVNERGTGYEIGISYAPSLARHPELIPLLTGYAGTVQAHFRKALVDDDRTGSDLPSYSLSLQLDAKQVTPQVLAVSADGDEFTGGAHGMPLVERWLWLVDRGQVLGSDQLLASPQAWDRVAAYTRDQLLTRATTELDAADAAQAVSEEDKAMPADADRLAARAHALSDAARWIDEGTAGGAKSFRLFEPMPGKDGRLAGLRFLFLPYQVGPYVDGVQSVEVPARVLLPLLAPAWQPLFEGGPTAAPTAMPPTQTPAAPAA